MHELTDVMDGLEPVPQERGDWDAVLRDASVFRRQSPVRPAPAVVLAAAALFALALFQPWEGDNPTFLERALAAVDDGPVLHVVLRGDWGGTLIDLDTGTRTPVHGETEHWYDTEHGRVHSISRLGDAINHEQVFEPRKPLPELLALGRDYRQALESGTARVTSDGVLDGERVAWITIRSEMLPDSADGKLHEWAQQVAVSRESFKPIATRETRDGEPGPGTGNRVLELEMLPADHGDFTASRPDRLTGTLFREGRETIARDHAADALGRTPLWLGPEHMALALTQIARTETSEAHRRQIRLTGAKADAVEKCFELAKRESHRLRPAPYGPRRCFRALPYGSVSVRPDGVYADGPVVWQAQHVGVVLFYGTLGDDRSTYREDVIPLYDQPHVQLTEATRRSPHLRGVGSYVPPDGSLFLSAGGRDGFLRSGGVYVSIEASSEELVLSAARALEPMPG
jgi:hypothetical protein